MIAGKAIDEAMITTCFTLSFACCEAMIMIVCGVFFA
jgi:hypothetical protein